MKLDDRGYFEWYNYQATDEEKKLMERLFEFGELFEDMTFKPGTSTYELIKCKSALVGSDEWIDDEATLPEILECFDYSLFRTKVEQPAEGQGYFDKENLVICVAPDLVMDDATVLHEMIHLHEHVINELPLFFHDMVFWSLYTDLRTKINGLDEAVDQHASLLNEMILYRRGGLHDILFLLKSFDLDIKKGFPLGTVLAYDGKDDFSYLSKET